MLLSAPCDMQHGERNSILTFIFDSPLPRDLPGFEYVTVNGIDHSAASGQDYVRLTPPTDEASFLHSIGNNHFGMDINCRLYTTNVVQSSFNQNNHDNTIA